MFKDDYRRELDKLTVSEKFKQDTISLMQERQGQLEQENKPAKTIEFNPKPYRKIAASVAVTVLALGAMAFATVNGDLFIGADSAAETEDIDHAAEQNAEGADTAANNYTADASPALSHKENHRVYTINDAIEVTEIPESEKKKTKVVFNAESDGNYGFEGFLYYDISELDTKNGFDENTVIDSLPIYNFSPMTNEDIEYEFNKIMTCTGMTAEDITHTQFEWIELMQNGDRKVISDTLYTDSPQKPTETCQLYWIKVELTEGYIEIQPQRSKINLYLYDDLPEDDKLTGSYAIENYAPILGENLDSYVYSDYNIYGEQHHFPHYVFNNTTNYGQYLFNNTVGAANVWHMDSLTRSQNDKGENIHFQYNADCAYTMTTELTAISWQQALEMFYNGQYLTTVPQEILTDTVVDKIELVYKEPPYYPPADYQSGVALPFYKLYIELPEMFFETDKGVLKNYGVYYVCAIHPDYVEYADGYIKFD